MVFGLCDAVARFRSVPLSVYDNPVTRHLEFSDELQGRVALLVNIATSKTPAVSSGPDAG